MAKILKKKTLAPLIHLMEVAAPEIARKRRAGQFIILRTHEEGERIPLTIVDSDTTSGTITLIFQEMGYSTKYMAALNQGDDILDLCGPLGKATHIEEFGTCLAIGGGVGVAPLYPISKALREAGNEVICVIGARNKELVIMEPEFRSAIGEVHVCTDDGSYGFHGFVTQKGKEILEGPNPVQLIVGIGPVPMMKALVDTMRPYNIPIVVSLNPVMIDGTGMCGGCRVEVAGKTQFACIDGPEFDGTAVNFDLLIRRLRTYNPQEKEAMESHACRLGVKS
ncbi:MAG: sulfide/dihydroorotate dehydrogenase-like FAD/NAD-binding protein [Armatimonadetes bacterium]|nr:sulfide/dihydroorotate dehydrogenase-like FAD/NAD-binding protein [Armatimonadota bacterium]